MSIVALTQWVDGFEDMHVMGEAEANLVTYREEIIEDLASYMEWVENIVEAKFSLKLVEDQVEDVAKRII